MNAIDDIHVLNHKTIVHELVVVQTIYKVHASVFEIVVNFHVFKIDLAPLKFGKN